MRFQQQITTSIAFIAIHLWAGVSAGFASSSGHYGGLFHQQAAHTLEAEVHDESFGSLGDHLQESEHYKNDVSAVSADFAEATAASDYHAEVESLGQEDHFAQSHYNENELGGHEHYGSADLLYSELENKPVPGIDHGKGAFSYSTLYETKEDKHE